MRITETQSAILKNLSATSKVTPADLAKMLKTRPGPAARSARSLVELGYLKSAENKQGESIFSRTAEGGKIAKSL
jgi:DNA-binding MarR family transcriptional regulator